MSRAPDGWTDWPNPHPGDRSDLHYLQSLTNDELALSVHNCKRDEARFCSTFVRPPFRKGAIYVADTKAKEPGSQPAPKRSVGKALEHAGADPDHGSRLRPEFWRRWQTDRQVRAGPRTRGGASA